MHAAPNETESGRSATGLRYSFEALYEHEAHGKDQQEGECGSAQRRRNACRSLGTRESDGCHQQGQNGQDHQQRTDCYIGHVASVLTHQGKVSAAYAMRRGLVLFPLRNRCLMLVLLSRSIYAAFGELLWGFSWGPAWRVRGHHRGGRSRAAVQQARRVPQALELRGICRPRLVHRVSASGAMPCHSLDEIPRVGSGQQQCLPPRASDGLRRARRSCQSGATM